MKTGFLKSKSKKTTSKEFTMLIVLVIMIIICIFINPVFISMSNVMNLLAQNSIIGVMALGMVFALITGSFDMSVSSTGALTAVVSTYMFIEFGLAAGIFTGLCVGIAVGLINGLLVTKVGVNAFVTTLGTQTSVRGLVYIITGAKPITGIPADYNFIGMGKIGGIFPVPALIWIILAVIMAFVLKKTRFGQYVYATGGNRKAAWLSGVNTDNIKISALVLSGLFAAIGGLIYTLRILMCTADGMDGYELKVMSACIVGGTSLDGGKGSISGCIIGTFIMGIILNILQLAGVSSFWQDAITGIILIGAVAIDSITARRRE
ncbi:ABC transporter permease [Wansuia hejianensis]|uniref:ABC transporter permease n=1 Tax=Wansuia hejianensis TaxID=2763667 RepID=A0A7G9GG81_9FIRM|nr:ABC transporter permease [Wansuia hejianensis]QNM09813.1 ABC transporter permease [Wansuia hejianensis]